MKQIISFLAFILFFIPHFYGQTFASATQLLKPDISVYSSPDYFNYTSHHRKSPLIIVGIVTGSVGCSMAVVGFLAYMSYDGSAPNAAGNSVNAGNDFLGIMGAGIALFIAGGSLIINGVSNDRKHKLSLIAPKKNEIGLAYNS